MQIKNIKIFDSTNAADGAWIDVSNLVALSVNITGAEGNVWIEVSNDPNVNIDGANSVSPPSAPTLLQGPAAFGGLTGQGTYFVKITYITPWGETLPSSESSLAVSDGNVLTVKAPARDTGGLATGWNVYIGKATGTEVLQTTPAYTPARLMDANPGFSYATSGVLPLTQNFSLPNGFVQTNISPPVASTAGGVNTGVKLMTTVVGGTSSEEIAIFVTGTSAMVNPSCLCWKWLRVRKDNSSQSLETVAWLMGQNG